MKRDSLIRRGNKVIAEFLGYTSVNVTKKGEWGMGLPRKEIVRYYKPHNQPYTSPYIYGLDSESAMYYDWNNLFKLIDMLPDFTLPKPYTLEDTFKEVIRALRKEIKKRR